MKYKFTKRQVMGALRSVRRMLEEGKIKRREFDMGEHLKPVCRDNVCGTVGCIGGYMAMKLDKHIFSRPRGKGERLLDRERMIGMRAHHAMRAMEEAVEIPLHSLFYFFSGTRSTGPKAAIKAIDRCIAGQTPWKGSDR